MNAVAFRELLTGLEACSEAMAWSKGKDLETVWATCDRGDWMLWLAAKMIDKDGWPSHQEVVLAACDYAEPALKYVSAGEDRPRKCIEVTRAWAEGKATLAEVRAAKHAAYAAADDADTDDDANAADAAVAAASAAAAATAVATEAAANAIAAAAAATTADDADDDAHAKALQKYADLVRARFKIPAERASRR